ncbi:uncharacterized protein N7459_005790 [Penicillium hispanicum]|uniref:uncharacterized protein n=1 Tax=Penicillium hispanicum TaxID=1080232 RepID=UPI002541902C|nr:uncharacterized protein N7459_005790 [Penicillium hispanicum]KAJ5579805.1 hypothetical protein N7459_005790 [Penicillium hispanicum]
MSLRMCYDDVAWEQSDDISDNWVLQFLDVEVLKSIGHFVLEHNPGDDPEFAPGTTLFPEEKCKNEVAVMRYILDQTSIPVPFILHSGSKEECPLNLSPFIIMDHIEHETNMYTALNIPGRPDNERGVLDPNIDEHKLEMLYRQVAGILLQLSRLELPQIGSLSQIDDFTWKVTRRPLPMNMNELVRLGTLPQSKLPAPHATFSTASSYVEALASLNIQQLVYQRNDAIESADDYRRKFVARQLFYKLARDKKLTKFENGPFKLWCDDLRPANILLNGDLQVVGVVDWEFTYAAPVEFSYAPPWWLLIETPESAMRTHEGGEVLSEHMQRSWENGDFWVMYALLHSFVFDAIYWQKIDARFFGPTVCSPEEAWKERLVLLSDKEKDDMEKLVTRKLAEMKDRPLAWDPDDYTEEFRQELKRRRESQAKQSEGPEVNEVDPRGDEIGCSNYA